EGYDLSQIGAAYFASTTSPYREKQCATTMTGALDLPVELRVADFAGSLRAGSQAVLAAIDTVKSGKETIVAIADCRMGAADGANELNFGDAAAAFLFGDTDVIAEVTATCSMSADFHDLWRDRDDEFVRSWEDRFPYEEFYGKIVPQTAKKIMKQAGLSPADFTKVVLYAHTERYQQATAKALGFSPEQIQDGNYTMVGNSGAACAPLMLVGALETAAPGDKILYLGYGEGCDAIIFTVTDLIDTLAVRPTLTKWINRKRNTMNYEKYLRWKGMVKFEPARRPKPMRTSLPEYYRIPKKNLALYGNICMKCGTPQYPPTRICVECGAKDELDLYRFYGHKAHIKTFTVDYLADSADPPNIAVVVDFEGGGRFFTYLVDCELDQIEVGREVEMSFRCIQNVDGIHTYFWKAVLKQEVE
ncbi:MAG: OB-fold domain-containing protein, partial [Firmicutes bacterium]|nr:OB-fold domain-containing protein [Bacillota bacterium]